MICFLPWCSKAQSFMALGDSLQFSLLQEKNERYIFNKPWTKSSKYLNQFQVIQYEPQYHLFVIKDGSFPQFSTSNFLHTNDFKQYALANTLKNNWRNNLKSNNIQEVKNNTLIQPFEISNPAFEKIFGGNKIEIVPKGSVDISIMAQQNINHNPLLTERNRKLWGIEFDQNINLNLVGKVGERGQIIANFSSEGEFDFENQIKFNYTGKPNDILQRLEIGDVNFATSSQFMRSSESLFGIKTQLQVGKLNFTGVVSQKSSENQEIIISNGRQQREIRITLSDYEANQHYFLSQYFRENFAKSLQLPPIINSPVQITVIEVWVSNNINRSEGSRDIIALLDLGEKNPFNSTIAGNNATIYPNSGVPTNNTQAISNNLLTLLGENGRNPNNNFVQSFFSSTGATDNYAKLNAARKLVEGQDYTVNRRLGYISLSAPLDADQILAVSFKYTANGKEYQVGELSTDLPFDAVNPTMIYTKLLKNEVLKTNLPTWDLMMKNIYSLGAGHISEQDLQLQIYRQETQNTNESPIMMEGINTANKSWLELLGLDRVSQNIQNGADGHFDFLEGITIDNTRGKIVFPVTEPFGEDFKKLFNSEENNLIDKYSFPELYRLTKIDAIQQYSNKDRYTIRGTVQSQTSSDFSLGVFNLKPNSIKVYSGAIQLQENTDFTIDYESGLLQIINQALLNANSTFKVRMEDESIFGSQQKTFIGARLDYEVNKNLSLGATYMKLSERPFSEKVQIGEESISNSMVGADMLYSKSSPWLTRMVDKLPFIKTDEESSVNFYGEIAYQKPGFAKALNTSVNGYGVAYLDDFEHNFSYLDIKHWQGWQISGTPQLFPEHTLSNDLAYGYNRALLSFYSIDPIFYQNSRLNPNIDDKFLTDHRTRRVTEQEVFPYKEIKTGTDAFLPTLDLSFYPMLKGPYNYSTSSISSDGKLLLPSTRWGGIFKKIDKPDFDAQNIEFLELWLMDPSLTNPNKAGGDLYLNLGNISEDILKDGRKSAENSVPSNGDKSGMDKTSWGYVSKLQPLNATFENSEASRRNQDVGLDALSNSEEATFHSPYITQLQNILTPTALSKVVQDPSNDDYIYFRGDHFNRDSGILERYQYINGLEGNSKTRQQSLDEYGLETSARTLLPDAEDLNRDNTMNESENYYQYHISLRPQDMTVGKNYIVDEQTSQVRVLNRNKEVKWYKLRIPLSEFAQKYGNINDFKSIRYIRLFLTNFADTAIVRFAQMQFVKSDWRKYNPTNTAQRVISDPSLGNNPPPDQSTIEIANVNIEENGKRTPIPYVVPPGINRQVDYSNNNLDVQLNEQSLSLRITNLKDGYGRSAFKNASYDLRQYGKLEMFVHAEGENLKDGDAHAFIRLGTDDQYHYYEFEAPLKVTPYGSTAPQLIWPAENNLVVSLDLFVQAKLARDKSTKNGQLWATDEPFIYQNGNHTITIKGNPDLSKVKFYMLGIKNPHKSNSSNLIDDGMDISGEYWFNELRLTDFQTKCSWAATGKLDVKLADLGNISLSATKMSAGFGDIAQRFSDQNRMDRLSFDVMANAELGKFIHPKHNISIPIFFNFSKEIGTPEYNPFQRDVLLNEALKNLSENGQDSLIRIIQDYSYRKNFSILNARKIYNNAEKKIKPWNFENFSFSYLFNEYSHRDINTSSAIQKNYRGSVDYLFNSADIQFKEPFKSKPLLKSINYNLMPSVLSFRMEVNRIYHENTFRDNATNNILPTYYNKNFNTNRIYGLSWDLTKSLRLDFNATNYAIIEEPNGRIDGVRKDTLWNNFWRLGRNMDYNHMMNLTYSLPINKIPHLEWINITTRYGSQFNWQSEPLNFVKNENINLGNSIQNNRTIQFNPTLNFNSLYNKFNLFRGILNNQSYVTRIALGLVTAVKSLNAAYTKVESTYLPGYTPESTLLGYSFNNNAPGWDFILGSQIDIKSRAQNNNWLTTDSLQQGMYTKSYAENISTLIQAEPFKNFRIDFNVTKIDNYNISIPFQSFEDTYRNQTGNYTISQIGIKNSFKNTATLYQKFEEAKVEVSELLGNYNPNSSGRDAKFFHDGYNENQQDVVVNAFLKTYLNKKYMISEANKPATPLPNWRINYTGLAKLLGIEEIIRTIHVNHTYQSQYIIHSYFTNNDFKTEENFPYIRDIKNNFIAPNQYTQISLVDRFLPLFGLDMRFDNNMSINAEFRKIRDINLSFENSQMSIFSEKSYIAGWSFRKLNTILPFGIFADRNWKNDFNFRVDFALNDRKIQMYRTGVSYEEITGGNKNITFNPSLDYTINRLYNIRLFYNSNVVKPYTSQNFATSYNYFGVNLKILFQ